MSFDLYVWHEPAPITADAARAKLERWDEGDADVFKPHPAVPMMRDAILERFPALESLSDEDIDTLGVWSLTPERSDSILVLSCVWSRADEVAGVVLAMAADHRLVCYEPGHHILDPNAAGYVPAFTLTSATLPTVPDPDERRIDWTIRKLGSGNHFAILERADGWYAQVGYGPQAGTSAGIYVLEHREGSADKHMRAETRDLAEATRFLQEFLAGTETWRRRHVWQPLTPQ
jgi:hypothetical protein